MRAFRIAYDGRSYHGFQRQPDVPTVSDAILSALRSLSVTSDVPPSYAAAGRTDAGVSALAQTVAFEAPEWLTPDVLSAHLPDDIRAWASADVSEAFHATHDATGRTYEYTLDSADLDVDRVRRAADRLAGTHDFHNLSVADSGTTRSLETAVEHADPYLVLTFRADGFPRQFVRRAVALITDIATTNRPLSWIDRVLASDPLDGPDGIRPAPPYPLMLADVTYPAATFDPATEAAQAAQTFFADRRDALRVRARVADRIREGIAPERNP